MYLQNLQNIENAFKNLLQLLMHDYNLKAVVVKTSKLW